MNKIEINARRNFLKYLAGSPLLAMLPSMNAFSAEADPSSSQLVDLISEATDALDVFEFEAVARQVLPPAHWGYLSGGLGDDGSIQANRDAFSKYYMRPRRLVGVENVDLSVELFGTRWDTPIILCPCGSQGAYHPRGELATAAAAKERGHQMILSTQSSNSVTDVAPVYDGPLWFQLYSQTNFETTRGLVRKAEAAGCPVIVVTVDQIVFGNSDTQARLTRQDTRTCSNCHTGERKPNYEGLPQSTGLRAGLNWDIVGDLRSITDKKIVLKGIVTAEDAELCLQYGVDGIIVSNHGGRSETSNWGSLDSLPEVVQAINGQIPVLIDGGFRNGMDVFKALALGADAICIGRPYLWGLAAFGQAGVEQVLQLLTHEFRMAIMSAGARSIEEIKPSHLGRV